MNRTPLYRINIPCSIPSPALLISIMYFFWRFVIYLKPHQSRVYDPVSIDSPSDFPTNYNPQSLRQATSRKCKDSSSGLSVVESEQCLEVGPNRLIAEATKAEGISSARRKTQEEEILNPGESKVAWRNRRNRRVNHSCQANSVVLVHRN
mgnify:FL=1